MIGERKLCAFRKDLLTKDNNPEGIETGKRYSSGALDDSILEVIHSNKRRQATNYLLSRLLCTEVQMTMQFTLR